MTPPAPRSVPVVGAPVVTPLRTPSAVKGQDPLAEFYKNQDRATLARQGRDHLEGRVDVRSRRANRWLWLILGTAAIAAVILIGATALYLMHMAQRLGTTWSATARQAASAYTNPEE